MRSGPEAPGHVRLHAMPAGQADLLAPNFPGQAGWVQHARQMAPQQNALDMSLAKSSAQRLTSSLRCSAAQSPAQRWPGLPSNSSAHCDPACGWALCRWCAAYSSAHAAPVAAAGRSLTCRARDGQHIGYKVPATQSCVDV